MGNEAVYSTTKVKKSRDLNHWHMIQINHVEFAFCWLQIHPYLSIDIWGVSYDLGRTTFGVIVD